MPALHSRSRQTCANALLNSRAFKFRNRSENTGHQTTRRSARVNSFTQRHKSHAARLPLVQQEHQMTEVSSESVEPPAHDGLEFVPTNVCRQSIEGRTPVLAARNTLIHIFHRGPAPRLDVPPQLQQLVLTGLISGRDSRVYGGGERLHRLLVRGWSLG